MRLSIDQTPVSHGSTAPEAILNSIDLAVKAEAIGYERYWVAEHHNKEGYAGASPEILIGAIAATSTIRVGSGGVMLSHYGPLKVAEVFWMLSALHPGRIDLGLGRRNRRWANRLATSIQQFKRNGSAARCRRSRMRWPRVRLSRLRCVSGRRDEQLPGLPERTRPT